MIAHQHASQSDLYQLLQGTAESSKVRLIGEHVHRCDECRGALESLAARSAIWKKTPGMLKDVMMNDRTKHHCQEQAERSAESFESNWNELLADVLDRPRHPEMLGRIGKYDIEREVGRGGMGIVLKAHDAELNRPVAIKVLAPHLASHGTARKRFAQEAIAAAGVHHPNVIAVYGVSNESETPYIVMPFVDGPSLQTFVEQNGPLTEIEIVRVAMQISSGLAAAHSQGLVHRDIKPANILTEGGVHRVMITDFGLARAEDDASLTRTGWLMGTPNYMSPEQSRGQRADQRSDLFSLGSLIYFIATGRLPFRAETPLGVLHRIQNEEPTPVRQVNRHISQTLADVIEMLLQKAPERRFQTATELHDLLQMHLAYLHQPDASKPPRIRRPYTSHRVKRQMASGVAVLALSLICMALGYSGWIPLTLTGAVSSPFNPNPEMTALAGITPIVLDEEEDDLLGDKLFGEAERLYHKKRYEESLIAYQKAAKHPCFQAKSNYNVACILALTDRTDAAFESLNRAVEMGYVKVEHYRTDPDLKTLRGDKRFQELLTRLEELNKAEEVVAKARDKANDELYAEAETLYREALSINPAHEFAITNLGYVIHSQGRFEDALPWHERAARSSSFRELGNYNLACYYSLKKESDNAFRYLKKAIRLGLATVLPVEHLKEDSDLKNIKEDARFASALEMMEKHMAWHKKGIDPVLAEEYQSIKLDPNEHMTLIQKRVPSTLILSYIAAQLDVNDHKAALLKGLEPSEVLEALKSQVTEIKPPRD